MASSSPPLIPAPKAVLFDLFHTLACVPPPGLVGEEPVPRILGVPTAEWQRRYYDDDVLGRCLGHVVDSVEIIDVGACDAIFVGDGGSDEHRGARALGMQTVLVTRLAARWGLDRAASGDVDWAFEDVSGFVDALFKAAPSGSLETL